MGAKKNTKLVIPFFDSIHTNQKLKNEKRSKEINKTVFFSDFNFPRGKSAHIYMHSKKSSKIVVDRFSYIK